MKSLFHSLPDLTHQNHIISNIKPFVVSFVTFISEWKQLMCMVPDTAPASETRVDHEVMMAVDSDQLIIADVCRDGAWLKMPTAEASTLEEWR